MRSYQTVQGDTFDIIAKKVYGDEKMAEYLYGANPEHISTIIFSAGVTLLVPDVPESKGVDTLPPWRTA